MRAAFIVSEPEPISISLGTLMQVFAEGVKYTKMDDEKDMQNIWIDTWVKWLVHSNRSAKSKSKS
jgi:hypothetical protein